MQQVKIGTRVKPMGIQRCSVGDGCVCRAILIDPNPQFKYVAWDDNLKCRVEVNQDLVIKYGLSPTTQFYYLIAKLNTDMQGNVVSDAFTIEYLQLSESQNNDLSQAITEMGRFVSLSLTKVSKKGENGRDYSYIKVTPSNYTIDHIPHLAEKLQSAQSQSDAVQAMWQLVDAATSISPDRYLQRLAEKNGEAPAIPQSQPAQQLPQRPRPQVQAPQQPAPQSTPQVNSWESAIDIPDDFTSDEF